MQKSFFSALASRSGFGATISDAVARRSIAFCNWVSTEPKLSAQNGSTSCTATVRGIAAEGSILVWLPRAGCALLWTASESELLCFSSFAFHFELQTAECLCHFIFVSVCVVTNHTRNHDRIAYMWQKKGSFRFWLLSFSISHQLFLLWRWSVKEAVESVKCEVWSVKEAVGSEKCEVWSVKFQFGVRRAQCEVWGLECEGSSEKWEVWSVDCEVWSVKCEVWSVKEAVRSEKCEVWTVKCEVWSLKFQFGVRRAQCEVWSVRFGVWRKQWEVRNEKCEVWSVSEVWSVKCEVWSVKEAVRSEKCEVWTVKCGVWSFSLECEERSVKCEVWGLECEGRSEKWEVWSVKCEWSEKCEVWSVSEVRSEKCEVWSEKC